MKTQERIILLNPFSISLDKDPFMTMESRPVFELNDYKIYKYSKDHYVHTFKNIVFAERCKANKDLILTLLNDVKPTGVAALYHDYERPKGAIQQGIEAAKKLNFLIK